MKEQKHLGPEFAAQLQADTDRYLPGYPAFCAKLTGNFVRAAGLLPSGG